MNTKLMIMQIDENYQLELLHHWAEDNGYISKNGFSISKFKKGVKHMIKIEEKIIHFFYDREFGSPYKITSTPATYNYTEYKEPINWEEVIFYFIEGSKQQDLEDKINKNKKGDF